MKTLLKILCVIFAFASFGHLVAGNLWFAGIALASICGYFGFRNPKSDEVATRPSVSSVPATKSAPRLDQVGLNAGTAPSRAENPSEEEMARRVFGLSDETPPELLRSLGSLIDPDSARTHDALRDDEIFQYAHAAHSALYDRNDEDEAIRYANLGLKLGVSPGTSKLLCTRAEAKHGKGDLEGALADYNESLSYLPVSDGYLSEWVIYRNRSYVYKEMGNERAAQEDYRRYEEGKRGEGAAKDLQE